MAARKVPPPNHIRPRPAAPPHVATPNAKPSSSSASILDTASDFDVPPSDTPPDSDADDRSNAHRTTNTDPEDAILSPPPTAKKRTVLPTASTTPKADLYAQFTLFRFSIGQLLEEDLPLSFYDMQAQAAGAAPRGRRRAAPARAPRVLSGRVLGVPRARAKDALPSARRTRERTDPPDTPARHGDQDPRPRALLCFCFVFVLHTHPPNLHLASNLQHPHYHPPAHPRPLCRLTPIPIPPTPTPTPATPTPPWTPPRTSPEEDEKKSGEGPGPSFPRRRRRRRRWRSRVSSRLQRCLKSAGTAFDAPMPRRDVRLSPSFCGLSRAFPERRICPMDGCLSRSALPLRPEYEECIYYSPWATCPIALFYDDQIDSELRLRTMRAAHSAIAKSIVADARQTRTRRRFWTSRARRATYVTGSTGSMTAWTRYGRSRRGGDGQRGR
ncbi:hypothetical protein K438DRAFT_1770587 [Mycena galopus ATCC 62051]|nr:hypothetical protein K438DRAFT_1770587 [Mycena galopus ATCC 62051]